MAGPDLGGLVSLRLVDRGRQDCPGAGGERREAARRSRWQLLAEVSNVDAYRGQCGPVEAVSGAAGSLQVDLEGLGHTGISVVQKPEQEVIGT
jgi:hypothetical protein